MVTKQSLFSDAKEAFKSQDWENACTLFRRSFWAEKNKLAFSYYLEICLIRSDYSVLSLALNNRQNASGYSLYSYYWLKWAQGALDELEDILRAMVAEDHYFQRYFAFKELKKIVKPQEFQSLWQKYRKQPGQFYVFEMEEMRAGLIKKFIEKEDYLTLKDYEKLLSDYPFYSDLYLDIMDIVHPVERNSIIDFLLKSPLIKTDTPDYRLFYSIARKFYQDNNYEKALEWLEKLLPVYQHHPLLHFHIGNIYLSQKKFVKAVQKFEKAINYSPFFERAHYNLALAYYELNQMKEAIDTFQLALKIQRKSDTLYNLAICSIENKDLINAYHFLCKIQHHQPHNTLPIQLQEQIKQMLVRS